MQFLKCFEYNLNHQQKQKISDFHFIPLPGLDQSRLRRRRQEVRGEEDLPALQLGVERRQGPGLDFILNHIFQHVSKTVFKTQTI